MRINFLWRYVSQWVTPSIVMNAAYIGHTVTLESVVQIQSNAD